MTNGRDGGEKRHGDSDTISLNRRRLGKEKTLYCSFCFKSQHEMRRLIAGPAAVYICDQCVEQ